MSVSAMLRQALRQIADEQGGYAEAHRGMLIDLTKGYRRRTFGEKGWAREDMHVR